MVLHSRSEPGGKAINEDYLIARRHPGSPTGYICLLADGQGGRSNGALAAKTACEAAWQLASDRPFPSLLEPTAWPKLLTQADLATATTGGFTTLIGLAIDHNSLSGASCGDSKAYLGHLTKSHDLEELTHAQPRNPPVGSGSAHFTSFTSHDITGARLIILSDGVWKYCGYESLLAALQSPDPISATTLLHNAVLNRFASDLPDDFSAIIADL